MHTTRQQGVGLLTLAVLLGALLQACRTGSAPTGDVVNGEKLFSGAIPIAGGNVPICADCHSVEPGVASASGPNLSNIGNRAAITVGGTSASDYLREAVVDPDAYLAGGFQEGIHYRDYGTALTGEQLDDLIAYMLTLRSGKDS